ncbi:MAG: helix-turn-helix transcriptional regulator [Candidatus Bipolaricaulota bacterium]
MEKRTFGDILRENRLRKGVSLRQLAGATGIDYSRLSRMETGTRPAPDLTALRKLARALDLELADLVVSAGTAREIVDDLLWNERLHVGEALADVAAYEPGASPLAKKNRFRVQVTSRNGARCVIRLGGESLVVFSFSRAVILDVELPPQMACLFRDDPRDALATAENVMQGSVRKARRLGQLVNTVLEVRGASINSLESVTSFDERGLTVGEPAFVWIPAAAIRTQPAIS